MAKYNNRDDFTKEVKEAAARRVCYQCSICSCLTSAASEENNKKVSSIGVAAHICAAAPKGPRYNPDMTPEERKDISNCIWLCQTHSRIIDNDVEFYTVEKLHEMKNKAEERVRKAMIEGKSFFDSVNNGAFTNEKTYEILEDLVKKGDFLKLKVYLESMKSQSIDLSLLDVIGYFKIVYCFYCDREQIEQKIQDYLKLDVKKYTDNLVQLFAEFFEVELLKSMLNYCEDEKLKKICEIIINDNADGNLFIKTTTLEKENKQIEKIEKGSFLHRLSTNYAILHNCRLLDKDGILDYYEDEYYYRQKVLINIVCNEGISFFNVKEQKLIDVRGFSDFLEELPKIKQLSSELQLFFWQKILTLSNNLKDFDMFKFLYSQCNDKIKNNIFIKQSELVNKIEQNIQDVEFDDIKQVCSCLKNYKLALAYLDELIYVDVNKDEVFFNDNLFLLKKHVGLLDVYLRMKELKKDKKFSFVNFLLKFNDDYKDDFSYQVLLAYYSQRNKKHKSIFIKSYKYLLSHPATFDIEGVFLHYLIVLYYKEKSYDKLSNLLDFKPILKFKIEIADCLTSSENRTDLMVAKNTYLEILKECSGLANINSNLCYVNYKLGLYEEAKCNILKELEIGVKDRDLNTFLQLKIETIDYCIDKYVLMASEKIDSDLLALVGIIYSNNKTFKEQAFNCFMKSLLINDNNLNAMSGLFSLLSEDTKYNKPEMVDRETVVLLKNEKRQMTMAIHNENIINGFQPKSLASIQHFSENDKIVDNLRYMKIGSKVIIKYEEFEIIDIQNLRAILYSYIMQNMIKNNKATTFTGTIEENIMQMKKFLEEIKEHNDKIVSIYNESKCSMPITIFANRLGKKILESYSFLLYENKCRIKNLNNLNIDYTDNKGYILSFDVIYVLAILDIDEQLLKDMKCCCSLLTKRFMEAEVDEIIKSINSPSFGGQVFVRDGQIYRDVLDDNGKRKKLAFFNKIKRILNILSIPDKIHSYSGNIDIEKMFSENKLLLENDNLGYAQNNPDKIFVNDDMFNSALLNFANVKAIGINTFLTKLKVEFSVYLGYLKILSCLNYGTYLTQDVVSFIKANVDLETNTEQRKFLLEELYSLLTSKQFEMDNTKRKYNNQITRHILYENKISLESENDVDKIIIKAVVNNYKKDSPKEYRAVVEDISNRFRGRLVEKDNKLYLETFLIKKEDL